MSTQDEDDYLLDLVYAHEQKAGADLASALIRKKEWDAFVVAFKKASIEAGEEVALNSLPFLAAALKLAVAAAI